MFCCFCKKTLENNVIIVKSPIAAKKEFGICEQCVKTAVLIIVDEKGMSLEEFFNVSSISSKKRVKLPPPVPKRAGS